MDGTFYFSACIFGYSSNFERPSQLYIIYLTVQALIVLVRARVLPVRTLSISLILLYCLLRTSFGAYCWPITSRASWEYPCLQKGTVQEKKEQTLKALMARNFKTVRMKLTNFCELNKSPTIHKNKNGPKVYFFKFIAPLLF